MYAPDSPTSVYIHVPYCQSHCAYCDFYSEICRPDMLPIWHDGIQKEIDLLQRYPHRQPLKSIYYGGGTPSVMDPEMLQDQLSRLRSLFGFADNIEITIEVNPESVTRGKADIWFSSGFNRASIGLQSADARLLRVLGRTHSAADFTAAFSDLRSAGFRNLSADIMVGVPGQTLARLHETLEFLAQHEPEHVSFYALSLDEGTPLHDAFAGSFPNEEEERLEREMYWYTRQRLTDMGLSVYEISNAGRPGFFSVHNRVYWRALPYFGLGPAAASYVDECRRQHPASLDAWSEAVKKMSELDVGETRDATQDTPVDYTSAPLVETISTGESRKEFMMLGLRLTEGIDLDLFQERFGVAAEDCFSRELTALYRDNLVEKQGRFIALTRTGIDFANRAFAEFV